MQQFDLFPPVEKNGQLTLFQVLREDTRRPDVAAVFSAPEKQYNLLPTAFEDTCKNCEQNMHRLPCSLWTKRQPFATFYCAECKLYLYIFAALPKPLLVWSDRCKGVIDFSKFIDELIAERNRKNQIRAMRSEDT